MSLSFIENEALVHLQGQGRLSVGRHSYGHPELLWWGEDVRLEIGSFCSIADGVTFMLGGNHRVDWVTTYPFSVLPGWDEAQGIPGHPATKGDIVVGSDVWIGNGALILSGVRIGHGAVIGARSLVAKDVPPYAIVGGNPARVIRNRFTPGTVGKLLEAAWWEWDEARIRRHMPLLLSGDVEAFLSAAGHPVGRDDPPRLRAKAGRILRHLIKGARNPLR